MTENTETINWRRVDIQQAHRLQLICEKCKLAGRGPTRAEYIGPAEGHQFALCFHCARDLNRAQAQSKS
jgi:hypothetical protein